MRCPGWAPHASPHCTAVLFFPSSSNGWAEEAYMASHGLKRSSSNGAASKPPTAPTKVCLSSVEVVCDVVSTPGHPSLLPSMLPWLPTSVVPLYCSPTFLSHLTLSPPTPTLSPYSLHSFSFLALPTVFVPVCLSPSLSSHDIQCFDPLPAGPVFQVGWGGRAHAHTPG